MKKVKKDDSIEKAVSTAITTLKDVLQEECNDKDHNKYFLRSTNHDHRKEVFDVMNKLFVENEGTPLRFGVISNYVAENFGKKCSSFFDINAVAKKVLETNVESGYLNIPRNIVRLYDSLNKDVNMYVYNPKFAKHLIKKSNEENEKLQLLDKMFFDEAKQKELMVEFDRHDTIIYNDVRTMKVLPIKYIEYTKLWVRKGEICLAVPAQDYTRWCNGKV